MTLAFSPHLGFVRRRLKTSRTGSPNGRYPQCCEAFLSNPRLLPLLQRWVKAYFLANLADRQRGEIAWRGSLAPPTPRKLPSSCLPTHPVCLLARLSKMTTT